MWMMAAAALAGGIGAAEAQPISVMVVGTYHFNNPGRDLHNPRADDVLKPHRQNEIEAMAAALAEYRPTKILVERVAPGPDLVDDRFASFSAADLATKRSEEVQIAYRLARRLGHSNVYAIDEQPGEGEPDYFPFGKLAAWAKDHGAGDRLDRLSAAGGRFAREIEELQARGTIPGALAAINRPEGDLEAQGFYYEALKIGDSDRQPGADLNAMWYLRNAKIFAKLDLVAEPGDRLLVVYGSGHNYWLRHFARTAQGYSNVDPVPYLLKADARLRQDSRGSGRADR